MYNIIVFMDETDGIHVTLFRVVRDMQTLLTRIIVVSLTDKVVYIFICIIH